MLNIKEVLVKMFFQVTATLQAQTLPEVQQAVLLYLLNAQDRFTSMTEGLIKGDLTKEFLLQRLGEEKDILYSELLSFAIIAKQSLQDAANKVQEIFLEEVSNILPPATNENEEK